MNARCDTFQQITDCMILCKRSSRSHAIFTVHVKQSVEAKENEHISNEDIVAGTSLSSEIFLVDLAGSEVSHE